VTAQRRLLGAQISASMALPAGATASGVIAVEIAGPPAAPLPLAVLVAGSGVAALTVGAATKRFGRRAGLRGAYAAATLGTLLTVTAAARADLALLLAASALFGAGNAAAMLTRYAAADAAPPGQRGRALSRMLLALTVGAIIVPNLLGPAAMVAEPLGLPGSTGLFLLAATALLAAIAVLPVLPAPLTVGAPTIAPSVAATRRTAGRRGAERSEPRAWHVPRSAYAPLAVLAVANLAMVTVMAVVPPLLHAHGASLTQVGLLVSAHVAAMYAPAPLAGRASDRYGARTTALGGTGLMAVATVLGLGGQLTSDAGHAAVVLLLVGAAWSAQVVAASAWLTHTLPYRERSRAEGIGEAGMAFAATAGGLTAAPLQAVGGTPAVLIAVLVLTLAVGIAAGRARTTPQPTSDAGSAG
jgi:MFS family permease